MKIIYGIIKTIISASAIMLIMLMSSAHAAETIGSVASSVTTSLGSVATMLGAASYVTGTGMFMVAIFQLKQHKENPTQTPLSKPMLFFVVAASLLYLPSLMGVTSGTLFASAKTAGSGGSALPQ